MLALKSTALQDSSSNDAFMLMRNAAENLSNHDILGESTQKSGSYIKRRTLEEVLSDNNEEYDSPKGSGRNTGTMLMNSPSR